MIGLPSKPVRSDQSLKECSLSVCTQVTPGLCYYKTFT